MDTETIVIIITIVIVVVLFVCMFMFMKNKFKNEGGAGFGYFDEFKEEDVANEHLEPINRGQIRHLDDLLRPENRGIIILRITESNFETVWNQIMDMADDVMAGQADPDTYHQFVDKLNWLWEIRITNRIDYNIFYLNDIEVVTEQLTTSRQTGIFTSITKVSFEWVRIPRREIIDALVGEIPNIGQMNDFDLIHEIKEYVSQHPIDGFNIEFRHIIFE